MEPVFSTPDPAEAERVRELLAARGLHPEMERGPDPVTGVGGGVFGGAGAWMYTVSVPAESAEAARALLDAGVPPASEPEAAEAKGPLPTTWMRRYGPLIVALFFLVSWVQLMLMSGSDLTLARWIVGALVILSSCVAIARLGETKSL